MRGACEPAARRPAACDMRETSSHVRLSRCVVDNTCTQVPMLRSVESSSLEVAFLCRARLGVSPVRRVGDVLRAFGMHRKMHRLPCCLFFFLCGTCRSAAASDSDCERSGRWRGIPTCARAMGAQLASRGAEPPRT